MNEDFENYVMRRCEQAISKNEEFRKLEKECNDEAFKRAMAEEICYKQGYIDALEIIKKM